MRLSLKSYSCAVAADWFKPNHFSMIKIQAPFKWMEPLPPYLVANSSPSFARPGHKQITRKKTRHAIS